ncbi:MULTISPECIES: hypothetical protein [unclassified Undibacterium]|uniref:hypothetical protein n=1 Tax=unclassified Undibacterium TaxID=2630295 RepID=UPI002AC935F2|nr:MULTISPECIES: hypothetical protein [unclassified Undibacterium]MEB0140180.1 hypothetical protein [Undibacterium sp. CCC2.1]MEB0172446.1 hypothetical protein [Undibacterium sp. CCC1.1]MEB0176964.1 hypothetical protein [Undibacterium sp. CCC3.4]MEB0215568.1 hypothetical protein [Undibacterium sp. 5I2]WPX43725.1 hypothetical protein RHM61_00350 [Undibacterium sp. CCC3.4]
MRPAFAIPDFINIQVTVIPVPEGKGNAGDHRQYQVTCVPASISVIHTDTIINYQIIPETPENIVFHGMSKKKPYLAPQFSHPSISVDRKMITFSDKNSVVEQIHVTLEFKDKDEASIHYDHPMNINFDPQVGNDPDLQGDNTTR